jgi:hypothetical protein
MTTSTTVGRAFLILATLSSLAWTVIASAAPTPRFPADALWYRDLSKQAADADSERMIRASIRDAAATPLSLRIDFSMHVLKTDAPTTRRLPLVPAPGYFLPDCDTDIEVPVPQHGAIEGSNDYRCSGQDCHLLVVDGSTLYEGFDTTIDEAGVHALCMVRWRLDRTYPEDGRGEQCTSADAAGLPIAPLMFNADEVAAAMRSNSDLGHALRYILPNSSMRKATYAHPATHAGKPSGGEDSIPYGARLRLKHSVPIERFDAPSRVILRTLQRYGAFVADGGRVPLTAQSDRDTRTKWADLGLNERALRALTLEDFEVMPLGSLHALTYDCRRNAVR